MSLMSLSRSSLQMQKQTVTQDASAGSVRAWANAGNPVRGNIFAASGRVQQQFQQRELLCTHALYLVTDPGPTAGCRFQTGDGLRTFIFLGREPPGVGFKQWPCVVHVQENLPG